ncbi:hypothetical protein GQ53DRAFT_639368, partial [Thozetella sp. PMI_491]
NACTQCRKVKMKCVSRDDGFECSRCARLGLECIRLQHRRGRKLGTSNTRTTGADEPQGNPPAGVKLRDSVTSEAANRQEGPWSGDHGFQPPDLLEKQNHKGGSYVHTVLGITDDQSRSKDAGDNSKLSDAASDPIQASMLNLALAESLFEGFMNKFNSWICQFDPLFHTFAYVRQHSPLLLTAVLAAAAKAFNTSLAKPLRAHAEKLLAEAFLSGAKSANIIHAILVLTYWKEPEDTRAWLFIGHAIRICHELGWHRLRVSPPERSDECSEESKRALRNVERIWLLLFVYDRGLSFQTGNPWMIERSEFFLEAPRAWHQSSLATSNDHLLCALVDLRLLSSDTFRPSLRRRSRDRSRDSWDSQFDQRGSLVRIILYDIERWENRWRCELSNLEVPGKNHAFMLRFYAAHLRLLLSSSPLESSISAAPKSQSIDKRALWMCFSSATDMLRLIADPEISASLYFAQDSIHVMTAYASAFLVKASHLTSPCDSARSQPRS